MLRNDTDLGYPCHVPYSLCLLNFLFASSHPQAVRERKEKKKDRLFASTDKKKKKKDCLFASTDLSI